MQDDRLEESAVFRSELRAHMIIAVVLFGGLLLPSIVSSGLTIWERALLFVVDLAFVAVSVYLVRSTTVAIDRQSVIIGGLRRRQIPRGSIVAVSERPENWIWPGRRLPVLTLQSGEQVVLRHFPIRSAKDAGARLLDTLR